MHRQSLLLVLQMSAVFAFGEAFQSESVRQVKTYPYSDPTPIALLAPQQQRPSYPYFRWDGYTEKAVQQEWKVVTLENDYISVSVLPEMGGKIWGAVEKSSGNEFIYTNKVMKFRDIAMRGAWTSGGIEFNFGILGHVPTTASPVDYTTKTLPDGSVSCYVASYEWITGAWWMVEINLPKDKAYFTTKVTWYNASAGRQPYYQWMNAAYSVRGDAEFIYPGNASISHSGDWDTYPITKEGKDIAWYKNIDFGNSMSVHVLGNYSNFYGIYWHDRDFGSAHLADHAEKLGMKYFIWSTARSGAIWEDLLTDTDGQYIEQQSGRMFCQPNEHCANTPFQHTAMQPAQTDTWTEYWFPIKDIGGLKQTSTLGSLNVIREDGLTRFLFCPLQKVNTQLRIYDSDRLIATLPLQADVLQKWETTISCDIRELVVRTDDGRFEYSERTKDNLTDRSLERPDDFAEDGLYGLYIKGENWANQKRYPEAESALLSALKEDKYYLPALTCLASVYNMQGRYEEALELCRKGLAVNTYDGQCNYEYAVASKALGETLHAFDGFAMAAVRDLNLRSAAYQQLAMLYIQKGNLQKASEAVSCALTAGPNNLDAAVLDAVLARVKGNDTAAATKIGALLRRTPLYQPARFEQYRLGVISVDDFLAGIATEMPDEVLIHLADFYAETGLYDDALLLLSWATSPIADYHAAWINHLNNQEEKARELIAKAQKASPEFVFPHRLTTLRALEWAESVSPNWHNRYYKGLVLLGTQQADKALEQLLLCDDADYAPLFLTRATLQSGSEQRESILRAERLDKSWRGGRMLITYYLQNGLYKEAVATGKQYHKHFPENYYLSVLYANALCRNGQYEQCIRLLENTRVLPYEGATEGHDIYRDAYLGLAEQLLTKRKYNAALEAVKKARLWPENLGVGMPYPNLIDTARENALEKRIYYLSKGR